MKKCYQLFSLVMVALLLAAAPFVSSAQEENKTEPAKIKNVAPSYNYWGIQAFGGLMQFNGDLSQNLLWNFKSSDVPYYGYTGSGYNYGLAINKQFTRVMGLRLRFAHGQLQSEVDGKYIKDQTPGAPEGSNTLTSDWFRAFPWESDLQVTVNWLNWILGYKPERLFSSYLIAGFGVDQTIGHKVNTLTGEHIAWIGQEDKPNNVGNTGGIAGHDIEWKYSAGIGFDFNIHKNWSIPIEFLWRLRGDDDLDMTKGGAQQVITTCTAA